MQILLFIVAAFLFKTVAPLPIPVEEHVTSSENATSRDTVSETIENLARTYKPEYKTDEELKLQARVTVTFGYTTLSEWLKSWVVSGYQPQLWGTDAWPLTQYVFDRAYGLFPGMTATAIRPTDSSGYVSEPSHYLSPTVVSQLKETAAQIWTDLQQSDYKIPFL